jgi:uncharacterized protein YbbC (DUF1343 family)
MLKDRKSGLCLGKRRDRTMKRRRIVQTLIRILIALLVFLFFFNGAVRVGADRLHEKKYLEWIKGKRVGLITNQTGVTSRLDSTASLLAACPETLVVALFAPEHGIQGAAQAGQPVASGPAAFSLYGEAMRPSEEALQNIDVLVYDIQDVGARFYTYLSTLLESMKAAAARGIPLVVLDRPDPINGRQIEGPVLEKGRESFIGVPAIPIRYGLTPGELAGFLNRETGVGCDLRVVPMKGWKRPRWYDETGLQWISPSPNMPSLATALVYPGACLFEATNLSEGRGTTRPFELIGAPWLDAAQLAARLNRLRLKGVRFREQAFTPTFSKYTGELCQGIQIHVTDRKQFEPVRIVLHVLAQIRALHPDRLEIQADSFDRLAGTSRLRERLMSAEPVDAIVASWAAGVRDFERRRKKSLLY